MSTVALTAPAVRMTSTRLRITRRGRRVLASLAAMPLAVGIAAAVLGGGSAIGSDEPGAPAGTFGSVTVMSGESLWSVAERVAPGVDPRDVVDEIVALNQLPGALVEAGQTLALPAVYSGGR
ncbi:LysM peptidoglycan-binding domain-containing protein [Microbacterium sp. G2-8]|uniref:LysM peptidoglycan-binding domain-containing protein n=1 Tax=Microbacterium sp. G2-8 TaxID=2842454 RepID=UPI001C8AB26E|nr:LysM peptidoglycan-binding domain-containing protein [Microbacterium sp. G2-8]